MADYTQILKSELEFLILMQGAFVRERVIWHVCLPVHSHGLNRLTSPPFGYKAFRASYFCLSAFCAFREGTKGLVAERRTRQSVQPVGVYR